MKSVLKLIGTVLISFCVSAFGFSAVFKLKRRKKCLSSIIKFCNSSLEDIKGKSLSVDEIFIKYKDAEPMVFKELKGGMKREEIRIKVQQYIDDVNDADAFTDFLYFIGKSDIEGQQKHYAYYTEVFKSLYRDAESDIKNKCRVYSVLSVCAGVFIFIILF